MNSGPVPYITPTISLPCVERMKRDLEGPGLELPGVYVLFNGSEIVYVGQSECIARRLAQHIKEGKKKFDAIAPLPLEDLSERLRVEGLLTLVHLPSKNNVLCLRIAGGRVAQMYYKGLWRRNA